FIKRELAAAIFLMRHNARKVPDTVFVSNEFELRIEKFKFADSYFTPQKGKELGADEQRGSLRKRSFCVELWIFGDRRILDATRPREETQAQGAERHIASQALFQLGFDLRAIMVDVDDSG